MQIDSFQREREGLVTMLQKIKKTAKKLAKATGGSDTTEMLMTTAMTIVFILVAMMFMTYIIEVTIVNTATKKVVRSIETTGIVDRTVLTQKFNSYLGNSPQIQDKKLDFSEVGGSNVNLKGLFKVTGSCTYVVPLINPGNFEGYSIRVPIKTTVTGMSEVYFGG